MAAPNPNYHGTVTVLQTPELRCPDCFEALNVSIHKEPAGAGDPAVLR